MQIHSLRIFVLAGMLLALTLGWGRQPGAAPRIKNPGQPKTTTTAAQRDYDQMNKELTLTADQQTKMQGKLQEMQGALTDWDNRNKDIMSGLQKDVKAAADKQDAKKLQEQIKVMRDERAAIETKYHKEIMNLLTPEQQITWAGNRLYEKGDYAKMVKALQFTPDQEKQLKDKVTAYAGAQVKWEQDNGDKMKQLEEQEQTIQKAISELRGQQEKINADNKAAITAVPTPEQQAKWAALSLQQEVITHFVKAKLTDEQKDKITPLCDAAIKEMTPLPASDTKGREAAKSRLLQNVNDQVLTDAQREAMKTKTGRQKTPAAG